MSTSGLLQETRSIHDSMNIPKNQIHFLNILTFMSITNFMLSCVGHEKTYVHLPEANGELLPMMHGKHHQLHTHPELTSPSYC